MILQNDFFVSKNSFPIRQPQTWQVCSLTRKIASATLQGIISFSRFQKQLQEKRR